MNQAALHRFLAEERYGAAWSGKEEQLFELRLQTNLAIIQHLFFSLYNEEKHQREFRELLDLLPKLFQSRPAELQAQDLVRLGQENWYQSEKMAGMQLYVDRFCGNLTDLESRLEYIADLGVNFLHLMPITSRPAGPNDGGYAVNSYTEVDPRYGSESELLSLTRSMRKRGMFLMLDFVVNHTSDEFPWAKKAASGIGKYQDYYYTFADRRLPDKYEKTLPEIFAESSPGNFTYNSEMDRWVMTVFNSYQWDLNYQNPEVFMSMLKHLVEMVNLGVDMVRFDALAFLWKKMGTVSQNLPEAHALISLFKMCLQAVAPGVVLLAEAIVAPREIIRYFGEGIRLGNECELAYNATLMALLWNSIATKKSLLLYKNLKNLPQKPIDCSWINYVRCHDDIGLGFDDKYIYEVGWDAGSHRKFLLDYYAQKFDWSPAKGFVFMYNPENGDGRITGSAASLAGLEKAMEAGDPEMIATSESKILMLYAIVIAYGGIPMIYAGDEIAMLNDYSYLHEEDKKDDSRWVNRPLHDWNSAAGIKKGNSPAARVYKKMRHLLRQRKKFRVFADRNNLELHESYNPHIFIFERTARRGKQLLVICNFDDREQVVDGSRIAQMGYVKDSGLQDLASGTTLKLQSGLLALAPFQVLWLKQY